MIKITEIQNGCNCYLVEQGDHAVLIDPGVHDGIHKVIQACEGKDVRLIILTHGHIDHISGVAEVVAKLNVPVAMNEKDIELISNNLNQPINGYGFMGKMIRSIAIQSVKKGVIPPFKVDVLLDNHTSLKEYGLEGKIIELPGHTKGSIALRIENHLFVGDVLMNMWKPRISYFYENLDDLKESVRRVTKEGEVTLHFGHGKPVQNRKWI